jgi:Family of unknown function (DUF6223)
MNGWTSGGAIDTVEQEGTGDGRHMGDISDASPSAAWLRSRVTQLLAAAALIVGFGLVAPAAAQVSDQPASARVYGLTAKRSAAGGAAVVGLISAVIGGFALARSAGRTGAGSGRRPAIVAVVMGPIGLMTGGWVVATADGGLGTGNGIAGAIVAVVVGLIGITLGGLALARARRYPLNERSNQ